MQHVRVLCWISRLVCLWTSMASSLSTLDFADILAALKDFTEPYELGIQLKIDSSILKAIERNHPGNVSRQKTEVIEYWLRNSSDASWTTLANAVERMGGHDNLAQTLREKEQTLREEEESRVKVLSRVKLPPRRKRSITESYPLDCVQRNILLLGKMGHGKSTLGNRMLNHDGCFKINDQQCPQTTHGASMIRSGTQLKDYKIKVYDHDGLFEGASSIDTLSSAVPSKLNVVIFVLKSGSSFDEGEILKSVMIKWQISEISALVLTHCERLPEEEREEMIEQFKKDHPSVAKLMGKGILSVGFPDNSHVQPGSDLNQRVEDDKAKVRQLIYSCDKKVAIMHSENERQQRLEKEFENSLKHAVSAPDSLPLVSQAHFQKEEQSSSWHCKLMPDPNLLHPQIKQIKSDSRTSQMDDAFMFSSHLQTNDDKISQHLQTENRHCCCCCSIL